MVECMQALLLPLPVFAEQRRFQTAHRVMVGMHTWLSSAYSIASHPGLHLLRHECCIAIGGRMIP